MPDQRPLPAPRVNEETRRFWQAAKEHQLLYGQCGACNLPHYYPRSICPNCFSEQVQWKQATGRAKVYTYSIMHRSATGPYVIAYVELAEGPRILTNLVDCEFDLIRIGSPVHLIWKATEGNNTPPLPFFTLNE
jgi:uncharacterized OB-fold protein